MSETDRPSRPQWGVVVGMDLEVTGEAALYEALRLAPTGAAIHLHLVHVLARAPGNARSPRALDALDARLTEAPKRLRAHVRELSPRMPTTPLQRVKLHVRVGEVAAEIHQVAIDEEADLVVVGTHQRRGLARVVLGNVAQDLLGRAHCPVLVVRPRDYRSDTRSERPEPLCPDCVATRRASGGATPWCAHHARPRVSPHVVGSAEVFSFGAHGAGIQTGGL